MFGVSRLISIYTVHGSPYMGTRSLHISSLARWPRHGATSPFRARLLVALRRLTSNNLVLVLSDSSMSEADRTKMAVGASGVVLGVVLGLCGLIYYHRKKQGD